MLGFSNAKINLGLNIIGKREDGYHNIESIFYPIPWADVMEVLPAPSFSLTTTGAPIPGNAEDNLIVKAWNLLGVADTGVKVHLHKLLPMGAGLGGGSSNAAYTLLLINEVLQLGYSEAQLRNLASELGSDCPFFIANTPAFCYGRGTELDPIAFTLKGKFLVVVNPGIHIATAEAYSSIIPRKPPLHVTEIIARPIKTWREHLVNDFEAPLLSKYPLLKQIKDLLYQHGAQYASMTGSGSTLYGIWEHEVPIPGAFAPYTCWSGYL